jgi:ankyrin repeat protein
MNDAIVASLFHLAAIKGNIELLQHYIDQGTFVDEPNDEASNTLPGSTALYCAVAYCTLPSVAFLLNHGADPSALCKGISPLHQAIFNTKDIFVGFADSATESHSINIIRRLLQSRKIDPNLQSTDIQEDQQISLIKLGDTPLHLLVRLFFLNLEILALRVRVPLALSGGNGLAWGVSQPHAMDLLSFSRWEAQQKQDNLAAQRKRDNYFRCFILLLYDSRIDVNIKNADGQSTFDLWLQQSNNLGPNKVKRLQATKLLNFIQSSIIFAGAKFERNPTTYTLTPDQYKVSR